MKIAMFGQKTVPSRMGGIEVVVENLATRMVAKGNCVALYNRKTKTTSNKVKEYKGVEIYTVPTIDKKGLAAVSGSFFASVLVSQEKYDIVVNQLGYNPEEVAITGLPRFDNLPLNPKNKVKKILTKYSP